MLLKTSTYLVGIWWDDFNAYVTSHGVRWSVRRRATGCIGGGHAVYAVDLSFDPHGAVSTKNGRSWWTKLVDEDSGSEVAAPPLPQDDDDSSDADD